MKILSILGARPQFIKAACLHRAFKHRPQIQEYILHTGQHYDYEMSEIFFKELSLPTAHYQLNSRGKTRFEHIACMLKDLKNIVSKLKPDSILVYGDTNSTLAGALISSQLQIPLIHIEAGLRSFHRQMPEENNRITTDRLSSMLFCSSLGALSNLKNEGFPTHKIYFSGDVMKDNAIYYAKSAQKPSINIAPNFILASMHRAYNTDNPKRLKDIFEALDFIASKTQIIFPLHPRTAKALQGLKLSNITFSKPLSYLETLWLLKHTQAVITDSGGLQKEAYFFGKPCLLLREESEYPELVSLGYALLVGADKEKIIQTFGNITKIFANPFSQDLYGDGNAGEWIAEKILESL